MSQPAMKINANMEKCVEKIEVGFELDGAVNYC